MFAMTGVTPELCVLSLAFEEVQAASRKIRATRIMGCFTLYINWLAVRFAGKFFYRPIDFPACAVGMFERIPVGYFALWSIAFAIASKALHFRKGNHAVNDARKCEKKGQIISRD